jgi:hypothetical protein
MIAVIVGGTGTDAYIETYSPDGRCSLSLGNLPLSQILPILGFINGKITSCSTFNYENRFQSLFCNLNLLMM